MPKPYPKEFRQNVIEVARAREAGTTLKEIAKDFGISESCLTNWIAIADRQDGSKPAAAVSDSGELREAQVVGSGLLEQRGPPRAGRTRCYAALRRTSRRRTCRENDVPARP
jgi:transposase